MTKETTDVLPLTFLAKIENMRDSCWDWEGWRRWEVLTCILAWEPGLSEGQTEGKQQFTTRSGQAQKASL